ncbi:MAG: hypothetical protein ABSE36_20675 [Terracidiphilus sp.]|jgi:putative heme iron utilization protein
MQVIVYVPDEIVDPLEEKLAAEPDGALEAVALDAILKFLHVLAAMPSLR